MTHLTYSYIDFILEHFLFVYASNTRYSTSTKFNSNRLQKNIKLSNYSLFSIINKIMSIIKTTPDLRCEDVTALLVAKE